MKFKFGDTVKSPKHGEGMVFDVSYHYIVVCFNKQNVQYDNSGKGKDGDSIRLIRRAQWNNH